MELYSKESKAPYIPQVGDNFDANYCNREDKVDKGTYDYYLNKINSEKYFIDFYYNELDNENKDTVFEHEKQRFVISNLHEEKYVETIKNRKSGNSTNVSSSLNTPNLFPKENTQCLTPNLTPNLNRLNDISFISPNEKKNKDDETVVPSDKSPVMRKLKI